MTSFRRSAAADTRKKGGGWKGGFRDRWKIPQNTPTPLLVIKSEYDDPSPSPEYMEIDPATGRAKPVKLPYYKFLKHRRVIKKGNNEQYPDEVCSRGHDPHNPQPCVGCYAMDSGDKSVSLSDTFALGVVHLAFYHGHPVIDDEHGGYLMKRDNSGPVLNYDECTGRTCNYCRVLNNQPPVLAQNEQWPNYRPQDITTVFGRRRYIEIGKSHLSNLQGWDQSVTSICGSCFNARGDQIPLEIESYTCPYCKNVVIDVANDPRSDSELADAVSKPYPCLTCRRPVLLHENVSCSSCGQASQLSIHDVVLFGSRQGESTKSQLMLSRFQTVEAFERAMGQSLAPFLEGKNLRDYIANLAKPFEFGEIMKPRSLQDQAKRLQLPLPGQGQPTGYSAYSAPQPQGYQQQSYAAPAPAPGAPAPMPAFAPYPQQAPQQQAPQQGPGPSAYVPPTRPNFGS